MGIALSASSLRLAPPACDGFDELRQASFCALACFVLNRLSPLGLADRGMKMTTT